MSELFHQVYDPVGGSIVLSALVASLPPILLAILLAGIRLAPWKSAMSAAGAAFLLAWLVWGMPLTMTIGAATHGMAFGLWPICWIVVRALADRHIARAEARALYEDLTPKPTQEEIETRRLERMYRAAITPPRAPDKRARRALRKLKEGE